MSFLGAFVQGPSSPRMETPRTPRAVFLGDSPFLPRPGQTARLVSGMQRALQVELRLVPVIL